jgi:hypothetical protein
MAIVQPNRNVAEAEAFADRPSAVADTAGDLPHAAIHLAALPRHPRAAAMIGRAQALEKQQDQRVADAIAQNLQPLGGQDVVVVARQQRRRWVLHLEISPG